MSGYTQDTLDLIQEIEKSGEENILFFKEKFFSIEEKIKTLPSYERLVKLRDMKISFIQRATFDYVFAAYVDMVAELGKKKDVIYKVGIICLMIPVICELIRIKEK